MKRLFAGTAVVAVVVAFVLAFAGGSAGATEPRRGCGPEVVLEGIPGHLDIEVNGVIYERPPNVASWSVTILDEDGVFTIRYFNESGSFGSTTYDVGPAQDCTTTTLPTTPTTTVPTTPPDQTFEFSVSPVCINDAPYLRYSASIPGFAAGTPMVLHWRDESGVERHTQAVTLGDGQVVWPGAEVAEQGGEPIDWPGWVTLPNGEWVQADDGFVWARGTVGIFASVNPTSPIASTNYPLPSPDCRVNPPGNTSIASLPETGTSRVAPAVLAGVLLVLAGACFVVVTRRRGERLS